MGGTLPRLKRRSEFLRAATRGRKWAMPGLLLQVRVRDSRDESHGAEAPIRVGFTASKKVGGAVARNRAKRRLRALADGILPVAAKGGRDYVLIARAGTRNRTFAGLQDDLKKALRKLDAERPMAENNATRPHPQEEGE